MKFFSRERFFELVRFCMVGGVSLALDYAILFALTESGVYYLYSSAISFSETELSAVTSSKVLSALAVKNISAVNFSALRSENVS